MRLSYRVNKEHMCAHFVVKNDDQGYFMEMIETALGVQYGDLQRSYNTLVKRVSRLGNNDFLSVALINK